MSSPHRPGPPKAAPHNLAPFGSGPPGGALVEEDGCLILQGVGTDYRPTLGPDGLLTVEARLGAGAWTPLLEGLGMLYRTSDGEVLSPGETAGRLTGQVVEAEPAAADLRLNVTEEVAGQTLHRAIDLRLLGASLEVRVQAPGGAVGEAYCGVDRGALPGRPVRIPGLPDPLHVLPEGFAAAYLDRFLGRAGAYLDRAALYRPDSEGRTRDVDETLYVTISHEPLTPLPGLRRPPAPYRIAVENRVTVDLFSTAPYSEDERLIRLLQAYGLDDVLLLYRNWQHYGYDRRGPALYPANPERGSNADFRALVEAAGADGWLVALREEYGAAARDSLYWNPKALALTADGRTREARPGHDGIAAARMLDFARLEATKIQRNYRPTAVFVDRHTAGSPEGAFRQVDDTAGSPCGTEADALKGLEGLLAFLREVHEGPVIGGAGEGDTRFDTFAGGLAEAVVRGPDGGGAAPLILDYELRVVRPRLLGIGAGSYRQFLGRGGDQPVDPRDLDTDAYRATEVALGHGGYFGSYRLKPGPRGAPLPAGGGVTACREYFLLRSLQEMYAGAEIRSIGYAAADELVDLAGALRQGLDLSQARVRVEYGNGLIVWVNRAAEGTWSVAEGDERFELPPNGFAAVAPKLKFRAYSALVDGLRTDCCVGSLYTFVDTRGAGPRTVEGLHTDGAAALLRSGVTGRQDVVLVGARELTLPEGEYRLSERGDVRFRHSNTRELALTVMDSESGKPLHVQWPGFTAAWQAARVRVLEPGDGGWVESKAQVTPTRGGPQLNRARPGVTYRVALLA